LESWRRGKRRDKKKGFSSGKEKWVGGLGGAKQEREKKTGSLPMWKGGEWGKGPHHNNSQKDRHWERRIPGPVSATRRKDHLSKKEEKEERKRNHHSAKRQKK